MSIRIGRGYEKIHHPYQELYEGVRPSIQGLRAAKFLPVAMLDKLHDDDPIVLLPGTFVGRMNSDSMVGASTALGDQEETARALLPASTNLYKIQYSAFDSDFGVYDIDGSTVSTAVSAAGTSTGMVQKIKPLGVITAPVYSDVLKDKYTNYKRDLMPSVLMGNYTVVIPAITNDEKSIEPGDLVRVAGSTTQTDTGATHYAVSKSTNTGSGVPGRLTTYDPSTVAEQALADYVVGRCIDKYVVARGTAVTRLGSDSATLSNLNTDHQYNTLKKVQTVPGLGLSGSGTQGVPAMFEHAVSDDSGDYFALVIKLDL